MASRAGFPLRRAVPVTERYPAWIWAPQTERKPLVTFLKMTEGRISLSEPMASRSACASRWHACDPGRPLPRSTKISRYACKQEKGDVSTFSSRAAAAKVDILTIVNAEYIQRLL